MTIQRSSLRPRGKPPTEARVDEQGKLEHKTTQKSKGAGVPRSSRSTAVSKNVSSSKVGKGRPLSPRASSNSLSMARASGDKHTEATPATTQTREKIRSITNIPKIRARPEAGGSVASKKPSKPLLQTENSRMIDGAPVASTSQASRQHLDPLGLPLRSPLPSSKGSISSSRPPSALKTPSASSSARKSSIRSNRSHASPLPPRSQSKQSASIEDLLETSYASFMNTSDSPSLADIARELEGMNTPVKGKTPSKKKGAPNASARKSSGRVSAPKQQMLTAQAGLVQALQQKLTAQQEEHERSQNEAMVQINHLQTRAAEIDRQDRAMQAQRQVDDLEDLAKRISNRRDELSENRELLKVFGTDLALWQRQLDRLSLSQSEEATEVELSG